MSRFLSVAVVVAVLALLGMGTLLTASSVGASSACPCPGGCNGCPLCDCTSCDDCECCDFGNAACCASGASACCTTGAACCQSK